MFARGSLGGEGVSLAGQGRIDDEALSRLRDLMMFRLRSQGLTLAQVAAVMGCSVGTVHGRVKAIPESVKGRYAKLPLG